MRQEIQNKYWDTVIYTSEDQYYQVLNGSWILTLELSQMMGMPVRMVCMLKVKVETESRMW